MTNMSSIQNLKKAKRLAKRGVSQSLMELATVLSDDKTDKSKVKAMLENIEQQRKEALVVIELC